MTRRALILVLIAASCSDDQGSVPQPQPVPGRIRFSSRQSPSQTKVLVLGLAGAVAGEGRVGVRDRISGLQILVDSASSGSFTAVLEVADPDLEAWFERDGVKSEPVTLSVRALGDHPVIGQTYGPSVVTPSDTEGMVTVSNDGGPGQPLLLDASPNVEVIVSNASSADVVVSTTDSEGRFTVEIAGAAGDTLHVMLVDPQRQDLTSDFVSFTAP